MTTPSETPRTDKQAWKESKTEVVAASFARTLELQLAQCKRALDVAVEAITYEIPHDTYCAKHIGKDCNCYKADALARIEAAGKHP